MSLWRRVMEWLDEWAGDGMTGEERRRLVRKAHAESALTREAYEHLQQRAGRGSTLRDDLNRLMDGGRK